ncbi:MAG TPA: MBL fold metallo-hydrolase [Streptosporangiaceae bacterium]|nr:MBL fold metallo-hydrolase [Streptosporangiaceae bacterium]
MIVTYLGHQGWSFESGEGHVFLDPVFRTIGNAGVRLPVWPDREIVPEALGPVAGIILSHEHSDHFDIDTLYRMPWRGEIFISNRSSHAMTDALLDLGYRVTRIQPYQKLEFPGLTITVLPLEWSLLEPDSYGFLVEAQDGTSFFTSVDGMPHEDTIRWLARNYPKRSVDNFTNNYMEQLPELTGVRGLDKYATATITSSMITAVKRLNPSRVVLSGQGWSYPPKFSALNHRFFNVTHQRMLPILEKVYPHIRWATPEPGTRIGLGCEDLDGTIAPFVAPRPTTARDYRGYTDAAEGKPWSGVTALPDRDLDEAVRFVTDEFGRLINAHAPDFMKRLFALSCREPNHLIPTIGLRLRDDRGSRHFVLDQGWLRFTPVTTEVNLRHDVACGVEVWASDLSLLARGREEAYLVYETAVRRWSNAPAIIGNSIHVHVFSPFGPRLQPAEFAASYRRRLAEVRAAADFESTEAESAESAAEPEDSFPVVLSATGGRGR